jgi:hypothetical protein
MSDLSNGNDTLLDDFSWDGGNENHSFFGIDAGGEQTETAEVQEVIKEAKEKGVTVTPKGTKTTPKKKVEVEPEDDDDNEPEEVEDDEPQHSFFEQDDDKNDEDKPLGNYTSIVKNLVDSKVFENVELKEGEEVDEDSFMEAFATEIEARVEEGFQSFMDELSDDGKAFLKYAKNGGTIQQFAQVFKNLNQMPEVDVDNEEGQKIIIRYYLKTVKQMESDDVDEQIEFYEDKNKLKFYAEKYKKSLDAEAAEEKEALIEQQENARKQAEENKKQFVAGIKKSLDTDKVFDIPIGKKDKDLLAYITTASVKIGPNRYLTGLQKDLNDAFNDPKMVIALAKLLKGKFDLTDIKASLKTEVTKGVKKGIENSKESGNRPSSSVTIGKKKTLADMF